MLHLKGTGRANNDQFLCQIEDPKHNFKEEYKKHVIDKKNMVSSFIFRDSALELAR